MSVEESIEAEKVLRDLVLAAIQDPLCTGTCRHHINPEFRASWVKARDFLVAGKTTTLISLKEEDYLDASDASAKDGQPAESLVVVDGRDGGQAEDREGPGHGSPDPGNVRQVKIH